MSVRIGINPAQEKMKNISYIKEIIYECAPISRAEIAEMLSLTPATISNNVALLIESGLIHEIQFDGIPEECTVGRRPIMLEFISDAKYAVGVEISTRGIFISICNVKGQPIYNTKLKRSCVHYDQTLKNVASGIKSAIRKSGVPQDKIIGVGVCVPGFIDRKTGCVKQGIWPEWEDKYLGEDLSKKIGFNVCVDNNASVRAVGEGLLEKDRPATFAYLFISKGISCPLMIQNNVISRQVTGAGEIGHIIMDINGPKCSRCGDKGCLETFSGEDAILQRCIEAIDNHKDTIIEKIAADPKNPTIEEIIEAASKGDVLVNEILDNALKYLAAGICNIIKYFSPEMVIIDGYIMVYDQNKEIFLNYIKEHFKESKCNKTELIFKTFDEFSGSKGSAAFGIKNFLLDS